MHRVLAFILSAAVFLLLITVYLHPITAYTQDLGRHLLTGKIILSQFSVPSSNLYSYTFPSFPFINHHWLSEVLLYLIHLLSGDIGLQLVSIGIVLLAFGVVFFFAAKKSSIIIVSFTAAIYLRILFERTDIRPEIFSFLLLSTFITILYAYRERFTRLIFLLIPLQLLWVNMHIYFFVGIVVLSLFLCDELYVKRKNLLNAHTKTLALVVICCIAVMFLNPNGLTGALYPMRVFQNYGYTIEENQSIFFLESLGFHKPSLPYFKLTVAFLFFTLGITWRKTRPIDWLLALTFSYAGFMAVRNLPLFVFTTFIPLCTAFASLKHVLPVKKHLPQNANFFLMLGVLLLLIWQIITVSQLRPLGIGTAKGAERGADFFTAQDLKGPIFNNFDIGSYLIYRLYPKERVFIDGRPEAYPREFIQGVYIPMQQDLDNFHEVDKQYKFNTIFFSHTDQTPWANQFLKDILTDSSWKLIYLDATVVIFLKDTPQSSGVTSQFAMAPDAIRISHFDAKNKQSVLQLASFFNKTGLTRYELQMYQHLLSLDPTHCVALYNSAAILTSQNDPSAASFATKYQQFCNK